MLSNILQNMLKIKAGDILPSQVTREQRKMINQRKALRTAYPDILTLSDITKILKISKRKAAWMLQNGYIKNINSGKKTRQYQVRINDLFEYMRISNFIKHSVGKNISPHDFLLAACRPCASAVGGLAFTADEQFCQSVFA